MTAQAIERAAILLEAYAQYSGVELAAALNAARRAVVITNDETGGNSSGLIEAFDIAIAMAQSRA